MALFAIADLHLSLGTEKPMDIFPGWQDYVARLEKSWRSLVTDEDTVVIAGDVSWAMRLEETKNDFDFLHSLPGKKLLLKGNHDYWWATKNKMDNYFEKMGYDDIEVIHNNAKVVGNIAVCGTRGWMYNSETEDDIKIMNREIGRLQASIKEAISLGKKPVVFLHYPPVYDMFVSRGILDTLKENGITDCYFGHIHGKQASMKLVLGDVEGVKMNLIACDYLNFIPLFIDK